MKKKILLPLIIVVIATLMPMLIQKAECDASIIVYGYTDKPQYMPGETITLKLWVYNEGLGEIVLKNVTVYLPWYSIVWGGNYTVDAKSFALSNGQYWNTTIPGIEIPTDGRAHSGNITIVVTYAIGREKYAYESPVQLDIIKSFCTYTSLENMDKLLDGVDKFLTLLTVLAVLVIVCTIIIAAVIFFSTRRPRAICVEEEEKEKSE